MNGLELARGYYEEYGRAMLEQNFSDILDKLAIGFVGSGGPFTLFQLKIIQECISLVVFTVLALTLFKTEVFRWNYLVSFVLILLAVYFAFKK